MGKPRDRWQKQEVTSDEVFVGPLLNSCAEYERRYMTWYAAQPGTKERARKRGLERAQCPDYVAANKAATRRNYLRRQYGLTLEERDALLAAQGGVCKLCGLGIEFGGRSATEGAHVDHCHTTGKVRGILCATHNTSLGKFNDDPVLLRKAADYLEGKL